MLKHIKFVLKDPLVRLMIVAIVALIVFTKVATATDNFGSGWRSRGVDKELSQSVTLYAEDGKIIKQYISAGEVWVGRSGCHFFDSETRKEVELQGTFVVE